MSRLYVMTFKVESRNGLSGFPVDMLRYDGCTPATESDSGAIAASIEEHERVYEPITLRKLCVDAPKWHPTYGRWESFGWRVVEGSEAQS